MWWSRLIRRRRSWWPTTARIFGGVVFLEAVIRKTPVPAISAELAVSQDQLLNPLQYQRRAVQGVEWSSAASADRGCGWSGQDARGRDDLE